MAKKDTIKKNKSTKKSSFNILALPKNIISEIAILIKSIGVGVFGVVDMIISFIVSFCSYLIWGVKNIIEAIWNFCFKSIWGEIYILAVSIYEGAKYIITISFYDLPLFLYNKCSKYVYDVYNYIKRYIETIKEKIEKEKKEETQTLSQKLENYIKEKYENLSFVKAAREKKEASLIILTINPNGNDAVRTEAKQTYRYLARNKDGKLVKGYFAALSRLDVYSYLIDEGMTVYEIVTNWAINFFHTESASLKKKMKNKDLVFWLAQLSTYIKAGIPLTDAVKVLAEQDKRKKYKSVYDAVIYELTMGETFSEALNKQGNVFPALLVNMIKSAEMIGNIEGTLDEMSAYYQEVEDTKRAVVSALAYPCIVLIFAIAIVVFMLVYIVPQFVDVYESMNAELNPVTVITLNISAFLQNEYMKIIEIILAIVVIYTYLYKKVKAFRAMMQHIFMKLPIIGNLIIYKEISLFARTFATLNKNNVLLTDSIDILGKITSNEIYKGIMYRTINNLLKGEKMSETFKDNWAVPQVAYYMILTGESTGELAEMLDKVGDYYQKLQKNSVNMIKTFIEPIMIIFLALIVGFILIAIVVPMFGMYSTIS
ncbi:MAG: type II secretion system F family protein [Bacilli bacterium]|nr:type II secretion system F family protein [Mollicutes bacterium]